MPPTSIETRAIKSAAEMQQANELMSKVFAHSFYDTMNWMRNVGSAYPGFRPEHTRIAHIDGTLAGALRITTDTIRIGEARLGMGGFGWIATAGHHRNKGVASALIGDGIRFMQGHACHVSMLFGIPNFYQRYGYTTTLAEYTTRMDVRDLPPYEGAPFKVRKAKPGDVRQLQKMHESHDAQTACSIIRCGAHYHYHWKQWENARVVMTQEGRVIGYFLIERRSGYSNARQLPTNTLDVEETGVINRAACPAIVEAAARHARENLLTEVRFSAPPGDPLVEHLLQYKSQHLMELSRGEGGMLCIINLAETLESMIPEWESQLERQGARDLKAELTLCLDGGSHVVRCHHGAISILKQQGPNKLSLASDEFVQLLTGCRHLAEILSLRRRIINADGLRLAEILFPKRHPYVWRVDRF